MQDRARSIGPLAPREWLVGALLLIAFAPALLGLSQVWLRVDYQSHGFLVPVVAGWIAMRERARWRGLEARPDRRGLLVVGGALSLYVAGLGAGLVSLQGLALVIAAAGAVLLARGGEWLRALAFPLFFSIFMVPVPAPWITPAIVKLQLFVSAASVEVLHAFGLTVHRMGNILELPGGESLFVAEACSGVTSIITLTPLAVLLGYFTLRRLSTIALLVASVVPLAMAGNLVRVVATAWAAEQVGVQRATSGPIHESAGLLTYALACVLMLGVGALLRRAESALGWNSRRG